MGEQSHWSHFPSHFSHGHSNHSQNRQKTQIRLRKKRMGPFVVFGTRNRALRFYPVFLCLFRSRIFFHRNGGLLLKHRQRTRCSKTFNGKYLEIYVVLHHWHQYNSHYRPCNNTNTYPSQTHQMGSPLWSHTSIRHRPHIILLLQRHAEIDRTGKSTHILAGISNMARYDNRWYHMVTTVEVATNTTRMREHRLYTYIITTILRDQKKNISL